MRRKTQIKSALLHKMGVRVDLEAMAMKRYSAFPKAPVSLESNYQIV